MKSTEHHKALQRSLEIKSKQWSRNFEYRPLTSSEENELSTLNKKLSEPVLNEQEFKIFKDVVTQFGGKIVPLPKPDETKKEKKVPKSFTKIQLKRELVYPYSGKSMLVFPVGSEGYLVDDFNDLKGAKQEEIDTCIMDCKAFGTIPAVIENNLLALEKRDFELKEKHRACA